MLGQNTPIIWFLQIVALAFQVKFRVGLKEYIEGQIWIYEYPVRYFAIDLFGRMTVIRLGNGDLVIHDPCKIDPETREKISELGQVKYIVAPGSYHHLFVTDFQSIFPNAETFICPGLERKRNDIPFQWILGNKPDPRWNEELDVVVIQGTKYIWEAPFFHVPSKTLILVDLLENIGDTYTHSTSTWLRIWWKYVYRMWNNPKAAPEYQMGWGNKERVRIGLERILNWNAERVILSHGELIEENVHSVLTKAWASVLKG